MKIKTSQYLKYCLICSRKTKKLNKKKLTDMLYKTKKNKVIMDVYDHYKTYMCYFCEARYTITSRKDKRNSFEYSKKVFWVEIGELYFNGNKICFKYIFTSKELFFYKNNYYSFCKCLDFKDAIKYISRYLQNQLFQ